MYDTPRTRTLAAHYDSAPPTPHAKHLTMPGFSRRRTMISALALAGVAPAFSASAISAPADPANPWDVRHTARRSLLAEDSWFCTFMEKDKLACGESTACAAADGCAEMFGQCHADYEYTYGTGSTASNWQTDSPRVKCILDRSDCQDDSMSEYTDIMTACEAHTTESACNGGTDCEWDEDIDIAIFAKSISNGYPFATIIGSKKIMQSGSETFISSTSWTERIGSVAAKATIEKYIKHSVHKKIIKTGDSLKKIWHNSGHKYSLDLQVSGLPSLPSFSFNNKDNLLMMSYYTARMLDFNILGFRQFKPSFSHNKNHLNEYKKAVDIIFEEIGSDKYKNVGLESQLAFFQRLSKE